MASISSGPMSSCSTGPANSMAGRRGTRAVVRMAVGNPSRISPTRRTKKSSTRADGLSSQGRSSAAMRTGRCIGKRADCSHSGQRDGERGRRPALSGHTLQGHRECVSLGLGQAVRDLVERRCEQIGQAGERKFRFSLDGSGDKRPEFPMMGFGDPGAPDGRLADACRAGQDETRRSAGRPVEEPLDDRAFCLAPDRLVVTVSIPASVRCG